MCICGVSSGVSRQQGCAPARHALLSVYRTPLCCGASLTHAYTTACAPGGGEEDRGGTMQTRSTCSLATHSAQAHLCPKADTVRKRRRRARRGAWGSGSCRRGQQHKGENGERARLLAAQARTASIACTGQDPGVARACICPASAAHGAGPLGAGYSSRGADRSAATRRGDSNAPTGNAIFSRYALACHPSDGGRVGGVQCSTGFAEYRVSPLDSPWSGDCESFRRRP